MTQSRHFTRLKTKSAANGSGVSQRQLAPTSDNIKKKWRIFALLLTAHFHFIMQPNENGERIDRWRPN
jgi:hypothetical protein